VTEPPEEKPLQTTSFAVHATRGLIRDQTMRRKTMFVLLIVALVMLFSGSTFLQGFLGPHEHPFWFAIYWLACGWLTLTAMLLALFDLLMVRVAARRTKKTLQAKISADQSPDSPRWTTRE
jgi:protein-S-isoprenylcysteine O-methyltransferase Ste14